MKNVSFFSCINNIQGVSVKFGQFDHMLIVETSDWICRTRNNKVYDIT